jgi:uncharacterized membrane protein YphA (DoxX/SURF4 family)
MNKADSTASRIIYILTWIFRILLGGTFVFSGFVKAIDPWGSLYKFEEYLAAMGMPVLHTLLITGVFALCVYEFTLGVSLLLGCYRRSSPIMALLTMCFMLPLTLWIAISDPVSDCGCFGDFFIISNWSTFWKNVILTLMAVWLIKFNLRATTIISPAFQWLGIVVSLAYMMVICFCGYLFQPLLDFRPYKAGTRLIAQNSHEDVNEVDYVFVYEKDGQRKEFGIDDELPDENDGWSFVERKQKGSHKAGAEGTESDKTFRIWSRDGEEDVTDEALGRSDCQLLLLMPSMAEVSAATTWKINALQEWATEQESEVIAVTDGTQEQIRNWEEMALPDYDIYTADDTAIKEIARGNPAVVMLKDGIIEWKSTLASIDADKLEAEGEKLKPSVIITNPSETLKRLTLIYIMCLAVPVAMSFMPRIRNAYSAYRKKSFPKSE